MRSRFRVHLNFFTYLFIILNIIFGIFVKSKKNNLENFLVRNVNEGRIDLRFAIIFFQHYVDKNIALDENKSVS